MRRPIIALAVLLLPLFAAGVARADDAPAQRCEGRVIEQPFTAFDDLSDYFLVSDGDFSSGAAFWDLGGAEVVGDNEPWSAHGDVAAALQLTPGASATSPTVCVAETDPTMRFFARGSGELQVDVVYADDMGELQSLTIGTVTGDGQWAPTDALPITANTYEMAVAFRFTAVGDSTWTIDDVYVDPYRKGRAN
jgi:hypothetical protein